MQRILALAVLLTTSAGASNLMPSLQKASGNAVTGRVVSELPRDGGGRTREYALEYVDSAGQVFPAKLFLFTAASGKVNEISLLRPGNAAPGGRIAGAEEDALGYLAGLITAAPVACLGLPAGTDGLGSLQKWLGPLLGGGVTKPALYRRTFKSVGAEVQTTSTGMVQLTFTGSPGTNACTLERSR